MLCHSSNKPSPSCDNTIVPTQTETTCSRGLAIFKAISFVDKFCGQSTPNWAIAHSFTWWYLALFTVSGHVVYCTCSTWQPPSCYSKYPGTHCPCLGVCVCVSLPYYLFWVEAGDMQPFVCSLASGICVMWKYVWQNLETWFNGVQQCLTFLWSLLQVGMDYIISQ